jgi:MFS family permease
MNTQSTRNGILAAPGALALLASSIVARLPLAMFSLALLVNTERLTGSFAVAGLASGAYAIGCAMAAPLVGGLIDRHGQTTVLVSSAVATMLVVNADGLLASGPPAFVPVALAAVAGACTPPLDACVRTLLPQIAGDPARLSRLFALESTLLELTFVAGPPLRWDSGPCGHPASRSSSAAACC